MGRTRFNLVFSALLLLVFLLLPTNTAAAPPSQCLAYAFTESENHAFLVQDNSSNFGSSLIIKTDCSSIELIIDGATVARSNNSYFEYQIEEGLHNITLKADGFNETYNYVSIYPDRLNWEFEWRELTGQDIQFIELTKASLQENWAAFLSVVIAWFLSTYVYWQLVQSYVQRNFIEEVMS